MTLPGNGIVDAFETAWPNRLRRGCRIVLAVSGGADSVALTQLVRNSTCDADSGTIILAHYNHAWRGSESAADQAFVGELAQKLGHDFVTATAGPDGDKSEQAARNSRYEFLQNVTRQQGARYLATAHTADDQIETILHRILRGTGLTGLTGIPSTRVFDDDFVLIRPLLGCHRRHIENYLASLKQSYRTDTSNADPRWTRNRLRHELLPLLRDQYNSDIDKSLSQLATIASGALAALEPQIERHEAAIQTSEFGFSLPIPVPETIRFPLIEALRRTWKRRGWPEQAMTAEHWNSLADVAFGLRNSCNLPGDVQAQVRDGEVSVHRQA
jgi:tRNA(Ile)-lysidine synthase